MKGGLYVVVAMAALGLVSAACSRAPDEAQAAVTNQPADEVLLPIERYRTALASVSASQQALALKTATINEENWSAVASESLDEANRLQGSIEGLMEFDEAAGAAATLRLHVASMQRQLQHLSADNWHDELPDLLLLNESIHSDLDELMDLAAPPPEEMPSHDDHLGGA